MNFFSKYFPGTLILVFLITIVSYAQQDESWKLYDDSQVARVDITIDPAAITWLYQNVQSDSEFVASFQFKMLS